MSKRIYQCCFILLTLLFVIGAGDAEQQVRADEPINVSRINFGSCIKQNQEVPIFDTILDQSPDLFVFLGDNIYADTEDMEVMRTKYQSLSEAPGFARLMEQVPVLATWDDHDYGVNDGGASYPKRVESEQLFLDFWKIPQDASVRTRPGVYDSHLFGSVEQRVQIILLDTRYFRGPLRKGDARVGGPYVPTDDPTITMLGEEQWRWLADQLRVPAKLRIIASSIQFIAEDSGQETWSNLPHERERMLQLIKETQSEGVVFISGDRHWSEISMLEDDLPYPLRDITSSSLNQKHGRGTPTDNMYREIPKTYHAENFGQIDIDWEAQSLTLGILDVSGHLQFSKEIRFEELSPTE